MERCVENVFTKLPIGTRRPPKKERRVDAEISLQAFVVNVSGCLDNLAWIWVKETALTHADGKSLGRRDVGFRKGHRRVRGSLSAALNQYFDSLDGWIAANEDYRDALAHRIPLYVPPYSIRPEDAEKYHDLERYRDIAARRGQHDILERLDEELRRFEFFQPLMMHSFSETRPMVFHAQLIADFKTIEEITRRLFADLRGFERQPGGA